MKKYSKIFENLNNVGKDSINSNNKPSEIILNLTRNTRTKTLRFKRITTLISMEKYLTIK